MASAFEPPDIGEFDPGVASSVEVPAVVDWDEITAGLQEAHSGSSELVAVAPESCVEVGPDQWRVDGSVTVPTGVESPTVLFQFVMQNDDVIESIPVLVEFSESGRFTFVADFLTRSLREDEFWWPTYGYSPGVEGCLIEVAYGSAATESGSWTIDAQRSSEPISWTAPPDSIQALGLGASMIDPDDPRTSWMTMAWLDIGPTLETVWVPTDPLLPLVRMSLSGACDSMTLGGNGTSAAVVELFHRCDLTYLVVGDPPAGSGVPDIDGFEYATWIDLPALYTKRDGWNIVIHPDSLDADWSAISDVARSLTSFTNLRVSDRDVPGVGETVSEAISEIIERDGLTERSRRQVTPELVTVVATGEDLGQYVGDIPGTYVATFDVNLRDGAWVAGDPGLSGGGDLCLTGFGSSHPSAPDTYSAALVGAEPTWTIQEAAGDGGWLSLDTVDGVAWMAELKSVAYRAIDEHGDPVYCTAGVLGDGETWSPWQLPNARWDLDLTAIPNQSLSDGDTIRIEGSGFPKNANIDIAICRVADPGRPDIADCQSFEESEERYGRTEPDGTIDRTYTATSKFIDDYGQPIDCTTDRCVIQVRTNVGHLRAGQASISFGG